MKNIFHWLKLRAPYLVMVLVVTLAVGYLNSESKKIKDTATTSKATAAALKVTVDHLRTDETKLRRLDQRVTTATCHRINKLQDKIGNFLEDSTQRSRRNAEAIIASPFSTLSEKIAAQQNLDQIVEFVNNFRATLPDNKCVPAI